MNSALTLTAPLSWGLDRNLRFLMLRGSVGPIPNSGNPIVICVLKSSMIILRQMSKGTLPPWAHSSRFSANCPGPGLATDAISFWFFVQIIDLPGKQFIDPLVGRM